ncbi:hypothetical protein CYMTET_34995 [Cymbomonas tetramitiformis]|uniref:Uncharacterized protein n=1 Tax=Cymbomonas tetramitiformis TaxID=36881 RepID=A0AAE0F9Z6_9CHLO|nr:hypothetical protein CYMTET_34995 [Cymbomonas tetramitiformis]
MKLSPRSPGFKDPSSQTRSLDAGRAEVVSAFNTFNALPPSSPGEVELYLGGSACLPHALLAVDAEFLTQEQFPTTITAQLHTAAVASDSSTILVGYTVRDAAGRAQVLTEGLSISMTVENTTYSYSLSTKCGLPDADGRGNCTTAAGSVWFGKEDLLGDVALHAKSSGATVSSEISTIVFQALVRPPSFTHRMIAGPSCSRPWCALLPSHAA